VQLLLNGLAAHDQHDLASVVSAMNRAATQDLRSELIFPLIAQVLSGAPAPNARDARMVQLMADWRAAGSSRLDRDGDGKVDAPGAAIIDAAWPRIADAVLSPVLGPQLPELNAIAGADSNTTTDFEGGRVWYVDKDLRTLLGQPVNGPLHTRFCGNGDLATCRAALWNVIDQAGGAGSEPGCVARGRQCRADPFRPGAAADDDALHQPPEWNPAGDLVRRP
jgi:hypothetical protein